ncbi:MAG: cupredoxin family protein [Pseudomonadota bacterium]
MRCLMVGAAVAGALHLVGPAFAGPGAKGHTHAAFNAGEPGDPKKPFRTIEIVSREHDGRMSFTPDRISVRRGEQIRFVIRNEGALPHELMLDSFEANKKHAVAMQKNPEMEHDDPNGKRTEPKQVSELLWRFNKAGTFEYACLIPGHYEAGMKGVVTVNGVKSARK